MSKKVLKLTETPINCYPDYVYPLSVILNEEKSLDWFYSNFIQIYHTKEAKDSPVNFYYSGLNNRLWDTCFPLLDYQIIHKDTINKLGIDIVDFIMTIIDTDNYCYFYLDEYYLPYSISYSDFHFPHVEFIYGYDTDKKIFLMSGYDKSLHYSYYVHKFEDVKKAYMLCERNYYDDKNNIYIFKYNHQGSLYYFDMKAVYTQSVEYLEAKDSSIKYNNCFNSRSGMTFGINVIMQIIDDIMECKSKNKKTTNAKPICIMIEHKILMVLRLKYMIKQGYIENDSGCVVLFEKLEKEYTILLHMLLKYNIKHKMTIIESIIFKLKENYQMEKRAFEKFIDLIK